MGLCMRLFMRLRMRLYETCMGLCMGRCMSLRMRLYDTCMGLCMGLCMRLCMRLFMRHGTTYETVLDCVWDSVRFCMSLCVFVCVTANFQGRGTKASHENRGRQTPYLLSPSWLQSLGWIIPYAKYYYLLHVHAIFVIYNDLEIIITNQNQSSNSIYLSINLPINLPSVWNFQSILRLYQSFTCINLSIVSISDYINLPVNLPINLPTVSIFWL